MDKKLDPSYPDSSSTELELKSKSRFDRKASDMTRVMPINLLDDSFYVTVRHEYIQPAPSHNTATQIQKVLINTILMLIGMLMTYLLYLLYTDLNTNVQIFIRQMKIEIAHCELQYHENFCDIPDRVPLTYDICVELEKCRTQNPYTEILRSPIAANMLGEVINQFVEPLSWKSLCFISLVSITLVLSLPCFSRKPSNKPRRH